MRADRYPAKYHRTRRYAAGRMDADSTRIGSHRMLAELDFATGLRTPIIHAFGSAADELARFVEGARRRPDAKSGHQVFAIFHLITRGLTDLIAGAHLLNHCYTVQAYSVMRPALDACDLIELFAADDGEASTWVMTEEGHKHFMPGQVRKRLGQKGHDPVHSHFSESGGHPRFAGAGLSGGMRVATDDPNDRTAILCIGPMWPEHPSVLFGWLFASNALGLLAFKARHLEIVATATAGEWLATYAALLGHLRDFAAHVAAGLGEPSVAQAFDEALAQIGTFAEGAS